MWGTLVASGKGARQCGFITSNSCGRTGPMAGIECSAPPDKNTQVRYIPKERVEANLCPPPADGSDADARGCQYGRVELLVASPSNASEKVWAPLCSVNTTAYRSMANDIAQVACRMYVNLPASKLHGVGGVSGELAPAPYAIPTGPNSKPGQFNPASFAAWATVPAPADPKAHVLDGKRLVQEAVGFKVRRGIWLPGCLVSSKPCESGALFSVTCQFYMT
ncbi:hypothetical protein TSOC_013294 [Tetrabaena socialis]|uniref:SRCR domain-containing protein n=1 Tax=Tetrabaena socialis TaxID=47790 RepID=A0A2J7ZKP7_9CHLO|nr:hypothetical protein TSOC_013294 [Tetrabaena socialis]|eukprot:PNH00847.1 hypothetical protein TSOC_013294 [Tetrabaena socialis]